MRPRTQATIMTSNSKRAICSEIGLDKINGDTDKYLRLCEYLKNNYKHKDSESEDKSDFCIDNISPPDYIGKPKQYGNTTDHIPVQFHQKGKIVDFGYDTQTILNHKHKVDFRKFASLIDPNGIDLEELLNIDLDNISEGKEIMNEMINNIDQSTINEDNKNKVKEFFKAKIKMLEANEENVKKFILNLNKVNNITYGQETNVYFDRNK